MHSPPGCTDAFSVGRITKPAVRQGCQPDSVTSDHGMATVSARPLHSHQAPAERRMVYPEFTVLFRPVHTQPQFRDSVYHALKDLNHVRVWKKRRYSCLFELWKQPACGLAYRAADLGWLVDEGNKTLPGAHGSYRPTDHMQVMFLGHADRISRRDTRLRNSGMYRFIPCWLAGGISLLENGRMPERS